MQQSFSKYLPQNLLIIAILLLGSIYLFHDSMSLDPAYMHSWTQSDRLAIAMNFQENGFDFFHPATYNLLTKDGITQVDFPIHDYLAAVISSLSGLEIAFTFRLYNLAFFLIGLFFFFKSGRLLNINSILNFFATCFIATLPFLVYYQNGFLPSIPSYATFCIGIYYLIKSELADKGNAFALAILCLTLSALSRIPFTVFLIALIAALLYQSLMKKQLRLRKLIYSLIGLGLVVAYFFYNQYLASKYGSMFLSTFRTADGGETFLQTILDTADRWSGQLFSPFHILLLLVLFIIYFKNAKSKTKDDQPQILSPFVLIAGLGVLSYYGLMSLQFIDHDYYFIDSFLPLFTLLALVLLKKIKLDDRWYAPAAAFLLISIFGMYSYARENQEYRYHGQEESRGFYQYEVYESAADLLDDWGVESEDTLAVFDINSTNLPFISWQNRGYTSTSSGSKQAQELLDRPFDFALLIDSFKISDSYFDYPEIAKQLEYVNGNDEISLYRKNGSDAIDQFFKRLHAKAKLDFEDSLDSKNLSFSQAAKKRMLDDMKGYSLKLDDGAEYPFTAAVESIIDNEVKVSVQFEIFPEDSLKDLQLIIRSRDSYNAFYLENEVEAYHEWQELQFHRRIKHPSMDGESTLRVYFWNPSGSMAYIDNYEILIYD